MATYGYSTLTLTIVRLFLLVLLMLIIQPGQAQGWEILPDYTMGRGGREQVRRIILCEKYDRPSTGFVQLRDSTPLSELVKLTNSHNPAMQLYAAYALADRHYPQLAEVFGYLLRKDHPIAHRFYAHGANRVRYFHASEALYSRIHYEEAAARSHLPKSFATPADSLLYQHLLHQLDSTALHLAAEGRHVHYTLLESSLENNAGYPGSYAFVRKLCRKVDPTQQSSQRYAAALAAYRQEQDIALIKQFGSNALAAIAQWPHPAFWSIIEQHRLGEKHLYSFDYYRAMAAYRTLRSAQLLDSIARDEVRNDSDYNNLAYALASSDASVFQHAIASLWVQHHAIALPTVQALIRRDAAQAARLFAQGFLSFQPTTHSVLLPQFYGTTADTVALVMLQTIQAQDTALFRRVSLHGARTFRWDELTALCRLDRRHSLPWLRQALLQALQTVQDAEGAAVLAGDLLKYNDPALAAQVRQILAASTVCGTTPSVWCDAIRSMAQPAGAVNQR